MICNDCPRKCNVDLDNNKGFCGKENNNIKIAKVMKHFWEEPIISGKNGSGAIFFSNCSLKCCFCQNYEISHLGNGKDFSDFEFIELIKKVESSGVNNINFVTPTHYTSKIIECLKRYRPKIPIVWNTSGYEKDIFLLKDYVDIFLFDFKYYDSDLSKKYSNCKDYYEICLKALVDARKIIPNDIIENGIMKKGIIVRHLILPGCINDSINIFSSINENLGNNLFISLMSQYVPCFKAKDFKNLSRNITPLEYKKVLNKINEMGFNKGFIQEFSSAKNDYTPNFSKDNFFEF